MKVQNLVNLKGNAVANQFIITEEKNGIVISITFQSYDSTVCQILLGDESIIKFGRDWDFSTTTKKNLVIFLSHYPVTKELTSSKDIKKAIEEGYILFKGEEIPVVYDEIMR